MHLLCVTHTFAPLGALSAQIPTGTHPSLSPGCGRGVRVCRWGGVPNTKPHARSVSSTTHPQPALPLINKRTFCSFPLPGCGRGVRVGRRGDDRRSAQHRGCALNSSLSGRGAARAEDAQGTPTQSHISTSKTWFRGFRVPLSIEYGTHETVKAILRSWLSGKSPLKIKLFPLRSAEY